LNLPRSEIICIALPRLEPVLNRPTHPAALPIKELLDDCSIIRTRGSGPGGQHRNKVETAIVITHLPTGISGQASEKRSQHKNRETAIERLRVNLALAVRMPNPNVGDLAPGQPSERWRSRVRAMKISVNPKHADYPALLAEALDQMAASLFNMADAAKNLTVSTSQLTKFLKTCPAAFEWMNRERTRQGLKRLS
jgi:hypothetical protein